MAIEVERAAPDDRVQIAQWLQDDALYADAFLLPAKPEPVWVRDDLLLLSQGSALSLEAVRFWSVRDGAALLGFAVDYPWEPRRKHIREIDMALPNAGRRRPLLPPRVLALVTHRLFGEHGATLCIVRLALGSSGEAYDRTLAKVGYERFDTRRTPHPVSGTRIPRAYYRCPPESFYDSPWGSRFSQAVGRNSGDGQT